jgi:hypothetical protein
VFLRCFLGSANHPPTLGQHQFIAKDLDGDEPEQVFQQAGPLKAVWDVLRTDAKSHQHEQLRL